MLLAGAVPVEAVPVEAVPVTSNVRDGSELVRLVCRFGVAVSNG